MSVRFETSKLEIWVDKALDANISYYSVRKSLLTLFGYARLRHSQQMSEHLVTRLTPDLYSSIVSTLTSRNDALTNDARLSFPNHVLEVASLFPSEDQNASFAHDEEESINDRSSSVAASSAPSKTTTIKSTLDHD